MGTFREFEGAALRAFRHGTSLSRHDIRADGLRISRRFGSRRKRRMSMSYVSRAKQIGRGVVVAGAVTALSLTAMPIAAHANGPGVGAAIGLGILGGAIAGAAIASSTPPAFAVPLAPAYYYPPVPVVYPAPYYTPAPYGYPYYYR
jgi:hypothetical protein